MRDLYSNIDVVLALAPAVQAAAIDGPAVDVRGVNRIAIVVNSGAIVGAGSFGLKLQEADSYLGSFNDVAPEQVQSNAPASLVAGSAYRLGYLGHKRYVRLAVTKADGTSIVLGAVAVRSDLAERPV